MTNGTDNRLDSTADRDFYLHVHQALGLHRVGFLLYYSPDIVGGGVHDRTLRLGPDVDFYSRQFRLLGQFFAGHESNPTGHLEALWYYGRFLEANYRLTPTLLALLRVDSAWTPRFDDRTRGGGTRVRRRLWEVTGGWQWVILQNVKAVAEVTYGENHEAVHDRTVKTWAGTLRLVTASWPLAPGRPARIDGVTVYAMMLAARAAMIGALFLAASSAHAATVEGSVTIDAQPSTHAVVYLEGSIAASAAPPPARVVMDQKNLAVVPHVLPVARGTVIEFTNSDDVQHNVFSPSAIAGKFNLGTYGPRATRTVTLDQPGDVLVRCVSSQATLGALPQSRSPTQRPCSRGRARLSLARALLPTGTFVVQGMAPRGASSLAERKKGDGK